MTDNKLKTVVVGLGSTGLSCVRYLKKRGCPVAVTDTRQHPPALTDLQRDFPDVPVALGALSPSLLNSAEQLVMSPGVSVTQPAIVEQRQRNIPIIGDVELFARANTKPVLAITGSNGKTTVTTLLGHMVAAAGFKVSVCGNIGRQVLDALDDNPDFYVLELSSFQLETTYSLKTVAATVLNVTPDHMDRYATLGDYAAAKQRIYQNCQRPVVNLDQMEIWQSAEHLKKNNVTGFTLNTPDKNQFGLRKKSGQWFLAYGESLLLATDQLLLQGTHHYQNALATLAMGYCAGLSMGDMLSVLTSFKGIAHRCELVAQIAGVNWINDSKGTNVGATIAAIQTLANDKGRLFLIAGGDAKNADLSTLRVPIQQYVTQVILFGQDANKIAAVIDGVTPYEKVDSLKAAVEQLAKLAKSGDTVLLSPACASFDMFNNYEHRGQVFADLVKQLL